MKKLLVFLLRWAVIAGSYFLLEKFFGGEDNIKNTLLSYGVIMAIFLAGFIEGVIDLD